MSGALFHIDQDRPSGTSHGGAGQARNDLWLGNLIRPIIENPPNVSYEWELLDKPPGSAATLTGATTPTPSFIPDVFGSYRLRCTTNGGGGSGNVCTLICGCPYDATGVLLRHGRLLPAWYENEIEDNFDDGGTPNARGWAPAYEHIEDDTRGRLEALEPDVAELQDIAPSPGAGDVGKVLTGASAGHGAWQSVSLYDGQRRRTVYLTDVTPVISSLLTLPTAILPTNAFIRVSWVSTWLTGLTASPYGSKGEIIARAVVQDAGGSTTLSFVEWAPSQTEQVRSAVRMEAYEGYYGIFGNAGMAPHGLTLIHFMPDSWTVKDVLDGIPYMTRMAQNRQDTYFAVLTDEGGSTYGSVHVVGVLGTNDEPKLVDLCAVNEIPYTVDIAMQDDEVYLLRIDGSNAKVDLYTFNWNAPHALTLDSTCTLTDDNGFRISKDDHSGYACVTAEDVTLYVIDAGTMTLAGTYVGTGDQFSGPLFVDNGNAFCATNTGSVQGLIVIDFGSAPGTPVEIGSCTVSAEIVSITICDGDTNTLYCACYGGKVILIDVSDPTDPSEIGSIDVDAAGASETPWGVSGSPMCSVVFPIGSPSHPYVAVPGYGKNQLQVWDAFVSATPTQVQRWPTETAVWVENSDMPKVSLVLLGDYWLECCPCCVVTHPVLRRVDYIAEWLFAEGNEEPT